MKKIKFLLLFLILNLFMFEIISFFSCNYFGLCNKPSYSIKKDELNHWIDDEILGVWHKKNAEFNHISECFNAKYKFNDFGAKDVLRSKKGSNRSLLIGDSFTEGYGIENTKIFSYLLEKDSYTNHEYLNFSSSGYFGTTQYQILFDMVSSQYNYDRVLLFLNPASDFEDDSIDFGRMYHDNKRRPYLDVNTKEIIYFNDLDFKKNDKRNLILIFLDNYTYTYKLLRFLKNEIKLIIKKKVTKFDKTNMQINYKEKYISYYKEYPEKEYKIIETNVNKILKNIERDNKKLFIFSVPSKKDLMYFLNNRYENNLDKRLNDKFNNNNVFFFSILDEIELNKKFISEHYFSCNDHFNEKGHLFLKEIIKKYLQKIRRDF